MHRKHHLCSSQNGSSTAINLAWLLMLSVLSQAFALDKTSADYYVDHLPGAPDGPLPKMHAGHVEVDAEHDGNLFFWHFENRHIANRQRTVIWLNGGPGCSSMDGALMEIGPYRVRKGGKLEYSDGSWDEFANLLFVDNPVGTGFSYVDTDSFIHELDTMASQLITFLEKWFALFPQYLNDDIYIAGESYAGQYIPYFSKAILDRNKRSGNKLWNLRGLLIGNGWISPRPQYLSYLPFAKKYMFKDGSDSLHRMESQQAICIKALDDGDEDHVDSRPCENYLQEVLKESKNKNGNCVNMYDVRLRDEYPSCGEAWPPDLEHVTPYLQRSDVTKALHVFPGKTTGWQECSGAVGSNLKARKSIPAVGLMPELLEEIPVLLFSGDHDLICNHLGTEEMIHNLEWNGGKGFEISPGTWAPRRQWTFEGEAAGMYQTARNLTYLLFYNSSHMVPFDYPRRTRDMLDRFIGVDIEAIGGTPADSRIDGEKGPQTSVGAHPNSKAAEKAEHDRLEAATHKAYYRSGELVFLILLIGGCGWAFYLWRSRRQKAGYSGLPDQRNGSMTEERLLGGRSRGLEHFRQKHTNETRDVEAADFDETELDDLRSSADEREGDRYSVGGAGSDDEHDKSDERRK